MEANLNMEQLDSQQYGVQYDILLIYSNDVTRQFIYEKLKGTGHYRVASVGDGKAAMIMLEHTQFDVIVSGIELDDLDIWRFSRMIRSGRFSSPNVPIIAVTDDAASLLETIAKEHDVHLVEANKLEMLFDEIETAINGRCKQNILIVEDDKQLANAAKMALEKNYHIEIQYDGQAGFDAWLARRHDLVLLDVMLPTISGPAILKKIQAIDSKQAVIILTAHATEQRHQDLMLDGAYEFLEKPLQLRKLRSTCEKVLRHKSLIRSFVQNEQLETAFYHVITRLRMAQNKLARGQAEAAAQHLNDALTVYCPDELSDDEWGQFLGEEI